MKIQAKMRLTDSLVLGAHRTIEQAILVPEVAKAVKDFVKSYGKSLLLIGGIAVSYYTRPRATTDADFLFSSSEAAPDRVEGFKRIRAHAFLHLETHVELEILDPDFLGISETLYAQVETSAVRVAEHLSLPSIAGLIALKTCRLSFQDKADIDNLLRVLEQRGKEFSIPEWDVPHEKVEAFNAFLKERC